MIYYYDLLQDLQLDYIDLYLVHWPIALEFTGYELRPGLPRDEETKKLKFAKVTLQETWQAMEVSSHSASLSTLNSSILSKYLIIIISIGLMIIILIITIPPIMIGPVGYG